MDLQQLIQQDANGTYCILFQNKAALTTTEIKEIFSKFGVLHSVQCAGDEKGYRFVRYKNYDDVKKAVEELKNHPQIKLGYHRKNRDQKTSPNVNNSKFGEESKFKNKSNFVQKENTDQRRHLKYDKKMDHNNSSRMSEQNKNGSLTLENNYITEKLLKSDIHLEQINNKIPDLINDRSETNKALKLENKKLTTNCSDDKVPDLIKPNEKFSSLNNLKKRIDSNAELVVVGNIPPNFGPSYILHLFDRYEPLAITKINKLKNSIRYCHVYFKTAQDSIAVESQFDKMDLSGQKLLVLRPYRLIEEALA